MKEEDDFQVPEFVTWLLHGVRYNIGRVYWNINQTEWDGGGFHREAFEHENHHCGIERITWSNHRNEDTYIPNVAFDGVYIYWYKYLGRGMSANVNYTNDQWIEWFNKLMEVIRKHEEKHSPNFGKY